MWTKNATNEPKRKTKHVFLLETYQSCQPWIIVNMVGPRKTCFFLEMMSTSGFKPHIVLWAQVGTTLPPKKNPVAHSNPASFQWCNNKIKLDFALPETNIAPENRVSQKRKLVVVFQPSILGCELLVLGRVDLNINHGKFRRWRSGWGLETWLADVVC